MRSYGRSSRDLLKFLNELWLYWLESTARYHQPWPQTQAACLSSVSAAGNGANLENFFVFSFVWTTGRMASLLSHSTDIASIGPWTELLRPTQSPELVCDPMARPCWTQRHCMLVLFQAVIYFSSRAWITEGLRLIPVGINSSCSRGATIRQPPKHRWRPLTKASFLTVFSLVLHCHYW